MPADIFDLFELGEMIWQFIKSFGIIWRYIFSPKYRFEIKEKWESGKIAGIIAGFILSILCNAALIALMLYLFF